LVAPPEGSTYEIKSAEHDADRQARIIRDSADSRAIRIKELCNHGVALFLVVTCSWSWIFQNNDKALELALVMLTLMYNKSNPTGASSKEIHRK